MNENLKETGKFYIVFLIGLALVWLGTKVQPPLSTIFSAVGAIGFFGGGFGVINWNRKKKAEEKKKREENNK